LTTWNRSFLKLQKDFMDLKLDDVSVLLVGYKAITSKLYRALKYSESFEKVCLGNQNNKADLDNANDDVKLILFTKICKA